MWFTNPVRDLKKSYKTGQWERKKKADKIFPHYQRKSWLSKSKPLFSQGFVYAGMVAYAIALLF